MSRRGSVPPLGESDRPGRPERHDVRRSDQLTVLDQHLFAETDGTRVVAFWAPSGMGKTTLLRQFRARLELLPPHVRRGFRDIVLDFADLSGSPLDTAVEFYRQYHEIMQARLRRFELVWASLFRARGQLPAIDPRRGPLLPDSGGDLADLAAGALDVAAHVPFVGLAPAVVKLGARAISAFGDHRRLEAVHGWFADRLEAPTDASLSAALAATTPKQLETLIPEALAADVAEHQNAQREAFRLLVVIDRYEALTIGQLAHVDRSTFPYRFAERMRDMGVDALFVIGGQHPLRWSSGSAGAAWQDRFAEHQLPMLAAEESLGYVRDRGVHDEALAERLHLLTRGCPALLAATLDLLQDEELTAAWESLDELRDDLGALDPTGEEGRSVFFSWYVRRLRAALSDRDDRYFDLLIAGSVLRSFDPPLLGVVLTTMDPVPALDAMRRYSFLEEITAPTAGRVPLRRRRYRIHELVRQSIALSELYQDGVRAGHDRALAHYGKMVDDPAHDLELRRRALADQLYHETCLDPDAGLSRCEKSFHTLIEAHDLTQCDYIVEALYDAPLVDPQAHARLLLLDSRRRRARHEYREAIESLTDARSRVFSAAEPTRLAVDITRNLAECYRLSGEPENAYGAWDELWDTGARLDDRGLRFLAAEGQMRSRIDHDELRDAAVLADRARRLLEELAARGSRLYPELSGERLTLRRAHLERQFSRICRFTGDYTGAYRHAQRAVGLYRERGDEYHAAYALIGLGHAHRVRGEYSSAIQAAETARAIFDRSVAAGTTMDRHGDPDIVGVSKVMQLLLLSQIAEDIEAERSTPGPDTPPRKGGAPHAWRSHEATAERLLRLNDARQVDPYAPIYAHLGLGEMARWHACAATSPTDRARFVAHARAEYDATISQCGKINGRVEAAYARIGHADLLRCAGTRDLHGKAASEARQALADGVLSDYPWIIFHAALELALIDTAERSIWLDLATGTCHRLRHPDSPSPFDALLTAVRDTDDSGSLPPIQLVTP